LYGSDETTLERLVGALHSIAPAASIVGTYAPPMTRGDEFEPGRSLESIRLVEPHIVWCGLGAPKQELFMHAYSDRLFPSLLIGVGAAFDFIAGNKQRAPMWMREHSLEWLYRFAGEPRRLGPRYLSTNGQFLLRAASSRVRGGQRGELLGQAVHPVAPQRRRSSNSQ